MTDRSWETGPAASDAWPNVSDAPVAEPSGAASAAAASRRARDGSTYYDAPMIAYYGPDGQVAYHPAPDGYQPPPEAASMPTAYPSAGGPVAAAEGGRHRPDPGWAALREAVWESGPTPTSTWAEGPAWAQIGGVAPAADESQPDAAPSALPSPPPPSQEPVSSARTVPVAPTSATKTAAHKVVPRPTAAHRISTAPSPEGTAIRPSQAPYRIGIARRMRSGFALVLLSVVLAGLLTAVLVAVVAGIASAISHAASP